MVLKWTTLIWNRLFLSLSRYLWEFNSQHTQNYWAIYKSDDGNAERMWCWYFNLEVKKTTNETLFMTQCVWAEANRLKLLWIWFSTADHSGHIVFGWPDQSNPGFRIIDALRPFSVYAVLCRQTKASWFFRIKSIHWIGMCGCMLSGWQSTLEHTLIDDLIRIF